MTPWKKRGKGQAGKGKGNAAAPPHVLASQRVVADGKRAQAAQVSKWVWVSVELADPARFIGNPAHCASLYKVSKNFLGVFLGLFFSLIEKSPA